MSSAAPPSSPPAPKRLAGLDGLRAIAILIVIVFHLSFSNSCIHLPGYWNVLISEGRFGVTIFFVLSGFLITYLLLHEQRKSGRPSLKRFYTRRAFRILPAAFFYLAAIFLLMLCGVITLPRVDLVYCTLFVRNLAYPAFGPSITAHYWSLSIEEQFYLVWPLLFLLTRGRIRIGVTLLFLAAAPLWRTLSYRYGLGPDLHPARTDLCYDALLMGCLLALLREDPLSKRLLKSRLLQNPFTMIPVAASVIVFGMYYNFLPRYPRYLAPSLSFIGLALGINYLIEGHRDPFSRLLNTAPFVWIGRMSYSLYLWQQLFIIPDQPLPAWMQRLPWNIAFVLALSAFSYYCVENPFLRLRERLESRHKQAAQAAPVADSDNTALPDLATAPATS